MERLRTTIEGEIAGGTVVKHSETGSTEEEELDRKIQATRKSLIIKERIEAEIRPLVKSFLLEYK